MGKSGNIVTILIIGAVAFLFFRFAKDPTGLKGLYTSTEKYFTETIKAAEKYITDATDAVYQTINPVATDPCDPYRLHGYTAYLACKAGIIGSPAEQGGASPGYYTAPAKCPYDQSLLMGDRRCRQYELSALVGRTPGMTDADIRHAARNLGIGDLVI